MTDRAPIGDLAALATIATGAGIGAWTATGYGLWSYGEPGPGLFPLIACAATIVFCALAAAALTSGVTLAGVPLEEAPAAEGPVLWKRLTLYIATILVWPWLLAPLGFFASTAIALVVIARFAEGMRWAASLVLMVLATGACWLAFDRLLGVPLPKGGLF